MGSVMSFDFPNSPSEDQEYTPSGGPTYIYKNPVWVPKSAPTSDSTKAPINSPAFTGNPTAPTPTSGDNDTSVATTQFVTSAIAAAVASGGGFPEAPTDGKQ